jgi:hypothetical protein
MMVLSAGNRPHQHHNGDKIMTSDTINTAYECKGCRGYVGIATQEDEDWADRMADTLHRVIG